MGFPNHTYFLCLKLFVFSSSKFSSNAEYIQLNKTILCNFESRFYDSDEKHLCDSIFNLGHMCRS